MASPFSDGLMSGFTIMETIRDRKEARANEARRLSLAEAANARADQAFNIGLEDRARGLAREDQLRRAASARARVLRDPDNVDEDDLLILEEAGDSETIAALENYAGQRQFATRSLRDLASRAVDAGDAPATQARSGGVALFTPQENAFLSPTEESELAPDQFPQPRMIPIEDIADFMAPDDPAFRLAKARGLDLSTPEGRAQARESARRVGTRVPVPPGVLSASEIDELPITEQEAARARNKELLGNRQAAVEQLTPRGAFNPPIPAKAQLQSRYEAMLDTRQDSDLRQLAATQPTAWIAQYRLDRNSLDENTRALVDRRAGEIAAQSLANLRQQASQVPVVNGAVDFSSPEGQALKKGIEQNIAVLSAVEKDFSAAEAANIRGGFMPVGNRQLAARVTEAWQSQPAPARPATPHEERMFRTQMARLEQAGNGTGASRRVSSAQIDALGKAVARGWIDYKDAESILLTGRLTPSTLQVTQRDPTKDLYINGRLVARGYDAESERKAREAADEKTLEFWRDQFELLYPGDEDWQKEERGRRFGQFLTQQYQLRAERLERHGFDPLRPDHVGQAAALANAFAAEDKADNMWDKALLGIKRLLYGPMSEQAAPGSDESLQIARDLLPDQYGVYTLGSLQFNAEAARRHFMSSGDPTDRAAVIATEGDDAALLRYVKQKMADQEQ